MLRITNKFINLNKCFYTSATKVSETLNSNISNKDISKLRNRITLLKQINENHPNADPESYFNLALFLNDNEEIEIKNGEKFNKEKLYLKSIDINPIGSSKSYHNLANLLANNNNKSKKSIKLLNGTEMTERELLLKSIELNPNLNSYYNLALQLSPNENSIKLLNGNIMSEKDLLLKSIDVDPISKNSSYSFNNLANLQKEGDEEITLINGSKLNKKQLYSKAIEIDESNFEAYYNLAVTLKSDEYVTIGNKKFNKKDLYIKLIELESHGYASTFYNLAVNLEKDENIMVGGTTCYNQKQLILKAIDLDPNQKIFYSFLYKLLLNSSNNYNNNDSVTLLNNTILTRKELLKLSNIKQQDIINSYVGLFSTLKNLFK